MSAAAVHDGTPPVLAAVIECNATSLPRLINAHRVTPYRPFYPYTHDVVYACLRGYRFEDGDITTSVTCSITGWVWNHIVTSCARMYATSFCRLYIVRGVARIWCDGAQKLGLNDGNLLCNVTKKYSCSGWLHVTDCTVNIWIDNCTRLYAVPT